MAFERDIWKINKFYYAVLSPDTENKMDLNVSSNDLRVTYLLKIRVLDL